MKLVFTEPALESLQECLNFFPPDVPQIKVREIRDKILAKVESLINHPLIGQPEEYLEHLGLSHRRLVEGHYKIIYRVQDDTIYIVDVFDSRQDPNKMRG